MTLEASGRRYGKASLCVIRERITLTRVFRWSVPLALFAVRD